jgi:hypothetical protein
VHALCSLTRAARFGYAVRDARSRYALRAAPSAATRAAAASRRTVSSFLANGAFAPEHARKLMAGAAVVVCALPLGGANSAARPEFARAPRRRGLRRNASIALKGFGGPFAASKPCARFAAVLRVGPTLH